MSARSVALDHYGRQRVLARRVARDIRAIWRTRDLSNLDAWWIRVAPRLVALLAGAQLLAASSADGYVDRVLREQGIDPDTDWRIVPEAFAGVASDGRPLEGLLYQPVIVTKARIAQGYSPSQAASAGELNLDMLVRTMIADAGRLAVGAALVPRRRATGYVRMLNPPSCARCAILAGKWFRWNQGFQRHPRCDCVHIPSSEARAGDLRLDPREAIEAGQVTGLSRAERQAILDGADPAQVVNARRGMTTTVIGGRRVRITTEGTTRRGWSTYVRRRIAELEGTDLEFVGESVGARGAVANYIQRRTRLPRLTPEEIYRVARTRDEAIRLLARNGYLTNVPGRVNSTIREIAEFAVGANTRSRA